MTTTTTVAVGRRIGPVGDPAGYSLQWWRDGARVIRPGFRPEVRRVRGINVGGDAPNSPIGSASASAEARRGEVRVEASPAPGAGDEPAARAGRQVGHARRRVAARAARARGRDLVGDAADCDSPLGESKRDLASLLSHREIPEDWIEIRLRSLGVHPKSPVLAWGPGPVSRAVRDVGGFRGSGAVRSSPSQSSILDARDAAAAAAAVWCSPFVTERQAELAAAAGFRERGEAVPASDPLGRWLWLLAYRAARLDLRSMTTAGLGGATADLPSVVRGEASEIALGSLHARESADRDMDSRSRRDRERVYREICAVLSRLGEDSPRQSDRTRIRGGALVVARILRDVVVGGESLRLACELHGESMDGFARRCERLKVWESLTDLVRGRAMEGSRPLSWLRRATLQRRDLISRIPNSIPDSDTSGSTHSRSLGTPLHGGGIRVTGEESLPSPDLRVGTRARLRRRARAMGAVSEVMRLREEIMVHSRVSARDMRERMRGWRDVAKGWREPGKVAGTPRRSRNRRAGAA